MSHIDPADDEPPRPEIAPGTAEAIAGGAPFLVPHAPGQDAPGDAGEAPAPVVPSVADGAPSGDVPDAGAAGPPPDALPDDAADDVPDDAGSAVLGPASVDVSDPDAEALSAIPLQTRVEALLFAATEPLSLRRLRELTACPDGKAVREAVETLASDLEGAGRAFRVEEVAQGYQLRTAASVAPVVARLGRRTTDDRLSTAALETLAVVAYRQPVLRVDVERIRGVACGEVLRALQERGLVRVAGRADLPGSPLLYATTQRFLEIFGLRDLKELPRDRELLRPAPADTRPASPAAAAESDAPAAADGPVREP